MGDSNIISVNVANFVTITIMAAIGLFLANMALKAYKTRTGG
jgi:hypothetical protein